MGKIPGVNHLAAIRALEKAGFTIIRQGKHIIMSDGVRILSILRNNPINALTTGGIVRDAGLTRLPLVEHRTSPCGRSLVQPPAADAVCRRTNGRSGWAADLSR
jgi:predicted RNA binding protein YcfA (HicA-like mRNA interferase family)